MEAARDATPPDPVAQSVEHAAFNRQVVGSIPTRVMGLDDGRWGMDDRRVRKWVPRGLSEGAVGGRIDAQGKP